MKIGLLVWGLKTKSQIDLASWGFKLAFKSKSQTRFANLRCLKWGLKLICQIEVSNVFIKLKSHNRFVDL
jgi:hypothetical protein